MALPIVGASAPQFSLQDQDGKTHALKDYLGRWTLLYFYPKDDTPGCTKEACGMRDNFAAFNRLKMAVLGVSTDSVKSHKKFADKFSLTFPLLADEEKKMVEAYGVWGEKKFMGRTYLGTNRVSFLVDPTGKVAKVYDKVKPEGHAQEVEADVRALSA
jgi:peroxiredoxin Q/BCP